MRHGFLCVVVDWPAWSYRSPFSVVRVYERGVGKSSIALGVKNARPHFKLTFIVEEDMFIMVLLLRQSPVLIVTAAPLKVGIFLKWWYSFQSFPRSSKRPPRLWVQL